jgi:DNA mismatch repair protein MutS
VARAREVLARLEDGRAGGGLAELPLFAAAGTEPAAEDDPLRTALADVAPDALAPRDALALIYRLKQLAEEH